MRYTQVLSDKQIIDLYFSRQESAIEETARKYGSYLLTISRNVLGDPEDSEECVNDTYWKAWNTIPPACPAILRGFLAKITRNIALDRYDAARRQKRIPPEQKVSLSDFEGVLPDTVSPEDVAEARELGRIISAYLDAVPDRRLYIFLRRFFFLTPITQIAQRLGCSQSTVHKELAAMKEELRQKLQQEGYEV